MMRQAAKQFTRLDEGMQRAERTDLRARNTAQDVLGTKLARMIEDRVAALGAMA